MAISDYDEEKKNKMPAILALRVMLGLIHLFQLYASPIDKTILANGIVVEDNQSNTSRVGEGRV